MTKEKTTSLSGLSTEEVNQRIQAGQQNTPPDDLTRSIKQIIIENSLTLFNAINIALAVAILLVSEVKNILFLGIVIVNTSIGIYQEVKAKKTIDSLTLLSRMKVQVLRNGQEIEIAQEEIVLDDILVLQTGDQICSDSRIVEETGLEVDESLLTGEADFIKKHCGDSVLSGSFVVAGKAYAKVIAVGQDNFTSKIAAEAKVEKRAESPLVLSLKKMMKYLTFSIIPIGLLLFYSQYHSSNRLDLSVLGASAAMLSMIPEGLMLLTSIAFAVGAANLAKHQTLVQSLPCIETLARVDVLCLDKTGTITDGTMDFRDLILLQQTHSEQELHLALSNLMNSLPDSNATAQALRQAFHQDDSWISSQIIPFSSARKWSGAVFEERGFYAFGAVEFLFTEIDVDTKTLIAKYSAEGYRVLGLSYSSHAPSSSFELPEDLALLGLVIIADNIRPEAKDTFTYFEKQDVVLKVISGDHPQTVSNIAQHAGITNAERYIDMSQVPDEQDFSTLVEKYTVFGRVTPYQKRSLIRALKANGHTTCMTGDGVNDVLSLREADVSVAMAAGSDAARTVSDIVLLNSEFRSMIQVLKEGRRVINNIERVASMYLVKTIYSAILAVLFIFVKMPYPFAPLQLSPINGLTVGIPSFFLALKPSYQRTKGHFLDNVLEISVPAALTIVTNIIIIQFIGHFFGLSHQETSTMAVLLTGTVGFLVLFQLAQPLDWKRKIMVVLLPICFLSTFILFRDFFMFSSLFTRNAFFYLPLIFLAPFLYRRMQQGVAWIYRKYQQSTIGKK